MWASFDNGKTLGTAGIEDGNIIRDEEHTDGARITLEKGFRLAPFGINCEIYSWMVHRCYYTDHPMAEADFEAMKAALTQILALIPRNEVGDMEARLDAVDEAIATFKERFS